MARTPIAQDKRLWLTAATEAAIVALMLLRLVPAGEALAALVTLNLAFIGQSQFGQTKRAIAEAANARPAP